MGLFKVKVFAHLRGLGGNDDGHQRANHGWPASKRLCVRGQSGRVVPMQLCTEEQLMEICWLSSTAANGHTTAMRTMAAMNNC